MTSKKGNITLHYFDFFFLNQLSNKIAKKSKVKLHIKIEIFTKIFIRSKWQNSVIV
jgi:hypothetical protein